MVSYPQVLVVLLVAVLVASIADAHSPPHHPLHMRPPVPKKTQPVDSTTPQQVHTSLAGDATQFTIQWVTWQRVDSIVRFGLSSGNYSRQASGSISTYSQTGWNGYIHTVTLTGLNPDTRYFYVCGSNGYWSKEFSFKTIPAATDVTIDVAVFGDMGLDYESDDTVAKLRNDILANKFDFMIHAGDIAYTYSDGMTNQTRFDLFMEKIEPLAAYSAYMVAAGNQELPYDFAEYIYRWAMPSGPSGSGTNLWYSYDVGPMHFTVISTEHHYNPGSPQYEWLINDLQRANANRAARPWLVMYGHRPLYCSNSPLSTGLWSDCYVMAPGMRTLLEPLFKKYSVDIYLSGHMHDAEFTFPVSGGQITSKSFNNPPSTVHIISGYAGCREGFNAFEDGYDFDWSVWRQASHYGYGHMRYNKTHVHFQFLYADDGAVHQELWITKDEATALAQSRPFLHPTFPVKNFAHFVTPKPLGKSSNIASFLAGFGIGMGMELGNIPECVSDYYPLEYQLNLSFTLLEDGFDHFNLSMILQGVRVLTAALNTLYELVEDCGGVAGLEDFGRIIEDLARYGPGGLGEEEILKIIENFPELERDVRQGIYYWRVGAYEQSGAQWGKVVAILLKPIRGDNNNNHRNNNILVGS